MAATIMIQRLTTSAHEVATAARQDVQADGVVQAVNRAVGATPRHEPLLRLAMVALTNTNCHRRLSSDTSIPSLLKHR